MILSRQHLLLLPQNTHNCAEFQWKSHQLWCKVASFVVSWRCAVFRRRYRRNARAGVEWSWMSQLRCHQHSSHSSKLTFAHVRVIPQLSTRVSSAFHVSNSPLWNIKPDLDARPELKHANVTWTQWRQATRWEFKPRCAHDEAVVKWLISKDWTKSRDACENGFIHMYMQRSKRENFIKYF